jgi:hypothetical protein
LLSFCIGFQNLNISLLHAEDATGTNTADTNAVEEATVHEKGWVNVHGKEYVKSKDYCQMCHGDDLSGGDAEMPCDLCHINPKHPDDWKDKHGQEYFSGKSECQTCHGTKLFDGKKRPMAMNCLRCHSNNSEIDKWQSESHTSHYFVNISQNAQISADQNNRKNFQTNSYVGLHVSERSKGIIFTSQLGFTREWTNPTINNVNLYDTYFQFDGLLNNHLSVSLGRQSFASQIDYYLLDGLSLTASPSKWFDIYAFAGIPRYISDSDLTGETGLATGLSWIFKEYNYLNARFDYTYQRSRFSDIANEPNKMYLGASASKGISIFKLYSLGEYNLTDQAIQTARIGSEIFPLPQKISFLIEGSYIDESNDTNLNNIFSIFSVDALWQAKAGFSVQTIKNLNFYNNISFQRYEILQDNFQNGYNLELGVQYSFPKIALDANASYYFVKSYGGTLHGMQAYFYEEWSPYFFTSLLIDYATYTKITNDDNIGIDVALKSGMTLAPGFVVSATAEYLSHDLMQHDVRGFLTFDFALHNKFLSIEDRQEQRKEELEKLKEKEKAKKD